MPKIQRDIEATRLDPSTGEELERTVLPSGVNYKLKWFQQFIDDVSPERLGLIRRSLILVRHGLRRHKYLIVEEKPNPENEWMEKPT
jgi:hypothetical protein